MTKEEAEKRQKATDNIEKVIKLKEKKIRQESRID